MQVTKAESVDNQLIRDIAELEHRLDKSDNRKLFGPINFWKSLCAKHTDLIREYGFEKFKRSINFEYSQWGVSSIKDSKVRHLLIQILKRGALPYGFFWTRGNVEQCYDIRWPDSLDAATGEGSPDHNNSSAIRKLGAYARYVGLLWQYALLTDKISCLSKVDEPMLGSPLPVLIGNKIVSQDLAMSAIELNRLASHIDLRSALRVAEIGAGYGRLAHLFLACFPEIDYTIFDIPPALALSHQYLFHLFGPRVAPLNAEIPRVGRDDKGEFRVRTVLPYHLADAPDGTFDLVINISSLDEMAPEQVGNYLNLIDKKCGGWVYLKGYYETRCERTRLGLSNFPYPPRWKVVYQGTDPVQPAFSEVIFRLN